MSAGPRLVIALALLVLLPIGCAVADEELTLGEVSASAGDAGTVRSVSISGAEGTWTAAIVVLRRDAVRATVIDQQIADPDRATSIAAVLAAQEAVAVIDGGYFASDFAPVGWLRVDGHDLSAASDAAVLSGAVAIDVAGRLELRPRGTPLGDARAGFQCGPFVIDPGGAAGVVRGDRSAARSVVALTGDEVLLIATSACSLPALARALHDHAVELGASATIERALNLDGGPSVGLAVRTVGGPRVLRAPRLTRCWLSLRASGALAPAADGGDHPRP